MWDAWLKKEVAKATSQVDVSTLHVLLSVRQLIDSLFKLATWNTKAQHCLHECEYINFAVSANFGFFLTPTLSAMLPISQSWIWGS